MLPLHHRMPVILEPGTADRWLDGDDEIVGAATENTPKLKAWPVDRRVNNARNESPELIEPAGDALEA
jgi:putative SOS response-associated peptidase YedK